jgi:hypothetical protein
MWLTSRELDQKFQLNIPEYEGVEQVVEIGPYQGD